MDLVRWGSRVGSRTGGLSTQRGASMQEGSRALGRPRTPSRYHTRLSKRYTTHQSTSTCPTHHLPAVSNCCSITARHRVKRSHDPGTHRLPSARCQESPGCMHGHVRQPDLHLRVHTVAISVLWKCTSGAQRLAVVSRVAHLRQTRDPST
jgi:hypothetical protein